jgi:hypothetical protein
MSARIHDRPLSIFDLVQAKNGVQLALWDGFLWKVRSPEKVVEWKAREAELQGPQGVNSAEMRLFVADIESPSKPMGVGQGQQEQKRVRQRFEAAIMKRLYDDGALLPDGQAP